jgi:acetyltransferase-like isoleucine patch superfamily enzyme
MKRLIKKIFGNTLLYKVISWAYNDYLENGDGWPPEKFKEYGKGAIIDHNVHINFPERIVLKDCVRIHSGTGIDSRGGLYIGEHSGLACNCTVLTSQHRYRNAKNIPFDNVIELKPVVIREFVWDRLGGDDYARRRNWRRSDCRHGFGGNQKCPAAGNNNGKPS